MPQERDVEQVVEELRAEHRALELRLAELLEVKRKPEGEENLVQMPGRFTCAVKPTQSILEIPCRWRKE